MSSFIDDNIQHIESDIEKIQIKPNIKLGIQLVTFE
jgi:hypothetical protein